MCLVLSEVEVGRNGQPTVLCRVNRPILPLQSVFTPPRRTHASRGFLRQTSRAGNRSRAHRQGLRDAGS